MSIAGWFYNPSMLTFDISSTARHWGGGGFFNMYNPILGEGGHGFGWGLSSIPNFIGGAFDTMTGTHLYGTARKWAGERLINLAPSFFGKSLAENMVETGYFSMHEAVVDAGRNPWTLGITSRGVRKGQFAVFDKSVGSAIEKEIAEAGGEGSVFRLGANREIMGLGRGFKKLSMATQKKLLGKGYSQYLTGRIAAAAAGAMNAIFIADAIYSIGNGILQMGNYIPSGPVYTNSFAQNDWGIFQGAETQRQASLAALHNTQLSVRAVLGNESGFIHQ